MYITNEMAEKVSFSTKILTQEVFFINDYEDMAFKSVPENGTFMAKIKGEEEFQAHPESQVLTDAILMPQEITAAQYASW